jgi:hypothetical protein
MYGYIFDFGDKIKIGQTCKVDRRMHTLELASGTKVLRQFSLEADSEYERLMRKKLFSFGKCLIDFSKCDKKDS